MRTSLTHWCMRVRAKILPIPLSNTVFLTKKLASFLIVADLLQQARQLFISLRMPSTSQECPKTAMQAEYLVYYRTYLMIYDTSSTLDTMHLSACPQSTVALKCKTLLQKRKHNGINQNGKGRYPWAT